MELRHLRYFLSLADALDIEKTAKHVGLSPATLRKHINDLEESMGCSLFRRHGHSLTLSSAGQVFYPRAKELLSSAAAAAGEARATAEAQAQQLRVGHYGLWWMSRYAAGLRRFQQAHPGLKLQPLELPPAEIAGALRRGEIDIALLEQVDVALRIEVKVRRIEALPCELLIPHTHALAKRSRIRLQELLEETWLSWDEVLQPGRRQLLLDAAKELDSRPCIAQELESLEAMLVQVGEGVGIGYAPALGLELPGSTVVRAALHPSVIEFPVFIAWRKDAEHLEVLEAFAKALLGTSSLDRD